MTTLHEELERRREGRTQVEFAQYLGISQSRLSDILAGRSVAGLCKTAAQIVRRFPELLPLFLPEDIATVIQIRRRDTESG